jgi:glutaredoxin-related protein
MIIDLIESDEFINMIPAECIKTNALERIKLTLSKSAVVVFMKGSPEQPADGYQKEVIDMMNKCRVRFTHFDVLKDSVN